MKTSNKVMAMVAMAMLAFGTGEALAARRVTKKELTGVVNLNTATAAQLDLLPGVGEKAAKRIIEFRAKTPFAKLEDLRKVKGFGPKKLEKMKKHITLSGPTTASVKKVKLDGDDGEKPSAPSPQAQGRRAGPGR